MLKRDRYLTIFAFLAPAGLLYAVFFLFPMAQAFYIAMFRWRGFSMNKEFVGFDNFRKLLFDDPVFWMALKHNFTFTAAALLIIIPVALFIAVALSRKIRGSGAYRAVYLFPNIISVVAVAVLWSFIYHPRMGILNAFLKMIGLDQYASTGWLGEPNMALNALIATTIWYSMGFYIVLFLAGVQSIPETFYEAALIDGANNWQSFRHVTLPLVWEILKMAIVYLIIHTLNIFGLVFIMTDGGPNNHTEVMLSYLYRLAFEESNFGYATALGVVAFILIFIISITSIRLMRREVVEY
jgi:N-acetylglucosamine transport system permease protein